MAVAESGSVTAAAAELRAPQPVVSRRIMALEKHLGSALFTRSGRRMRITESGRRLLPHAIDLVTRADHFLELAVTAQDRTLRVGMPPDADLQAMAAASVATKTAGFELHVVTAPGDVRQAQLAAGGLQVALIDSPVDTADIAIPIGVDGIRVSSKTGTFLNLRHDAGAVETDTGDVIAMAALTASTVPAFMQPEIDYAIGSAARRCLEHMRR